MAKTRWLLLVSLVTTRYLSILSSDMEGATHLASSMAWQSSDSYADSQTINMTKFSRSIDIREASILCNG